MSFRSPPLPSSVTPADNTLGILEPQAGLRRFSLERTPPPLSLALVVDWFWSVRWDLADDDSHVQKLLPHPSVNLALGTTGAEVAGVSTRLSTRILAGRGVVIAAKFTPGAFMAVCPMATDTPASLVDRVVPLTSVLKDAEGFVDDVNEALGRDDVDGARERLAGFLQARLTLDAPQQASLRLLHEGLRALHQETSLTRVDQLAARMGLSVRSLQRLFLHLVGVPAKTILQRARLQDVAEHLQRGESVGLAQLAAQLDYADQSHLQRDFLRCFGESPAAYRRRCEATRL